MSLTKRLTIFFSLLFFFHTVSFEAKAGIRNYGTFAMTIPFFAMAATIITWGIFSKPEPLERLDVTDPRSARTRMVVEKMMENDLFESDRALLPNQESWKAQGVQKDAALLSESF